MKLMTFEEAREIVRAEGWDESVKMGVLRNPDSALDRVTSIYLEGVYQGHFLAQPKARPGWRQEPWGE